MRPAFSCEMTEKLMTSIETTSSVSFFFITSSLLVSQILIVYVLESSKNNVLSQHGLRPSESYFFSRDW